MSILVTGFEPFGGSSRNASWEAVSLLPETIAGHAVYRMRLPVCYGQAGDLLVEMMRRIRPAVTLCCGVAGGRTSDALIAACARKAKVATLLTWNAGHFESLADGFVVARPRGG